MHLSRFWPALLGALLIHAPISLGQTAPSSASSSNSSIGTGVVEGRVFNAATGAALARARVTLEGTQQEAVTDKTGSYRLTQVPAGDARISATYIGLGAQTATVSVRAGEAVKREFELTRDRPGAAGDVVRLQEFNVVADREMSAQAIAMNEQRQAPNIKNVVAIDEFGDQGDETIMNFLKFIPGVAIADDAPGAGSVSLRGFPSDNTIVQFDGADFSSARTANSRGVVLIEVPMSNVSRVEVTKVPTPDMPASGLGGSINLISKAGNEVRRPTFTYQVTTLFDNRSGVTFDAGPRNHIPDVSPNYTQPSFNLSYLHPVNQKLAFSVGIARTWRIKRMMRDGDFDETSSWDLVRNVQTSATSTNLAQVLSTWSGQVGAEWRISPKDTLSASLQYRDTKNATNRSPIAFAYGAGAVGDGSFSQGAATGVGTVTQANQANWILPNENTHGTLKYAHRGDKWTIDGSGSYSLAEGRTKDMESGFFSTMPATIVNLIIRGDGIPADPKDGNLATRYSATTRTGVPVDIYDGANYSINTATTDRKEQSTTNTALRFNMAREFAGAIPMTLKTGVSRTEMEKDMVRFNETWNFRPNGATDVDSRLAGKFDVFDQEFNAVAPTLYGKPVKWISTAKGYELYQQHPDWFVSVPATTHQNIVNGSRKINETISSAYLRADFRLMQNRLWIVGGVRAEKTEVEGWGPLSDPLAIYRRGANGEFLRDAAGQRILITTDALGRAQLQFKERGAHAENDYSGFYPSLSSTFNITDNLLIRAAYARTIGRPNVSFVTPGTTISDPEGTDPTINVSNTALKPWTADSYDLSLESYFLKGGFGSIGVFQKNIKDFFGSVRTEVTPELLEFHGLENDPVYQNYDLVTMTNSGDAEVKGVEFSYRQALTFLPQWAHGFQVFANASKLWLKGSRAADFAGFTPSSVAAGINFLRPRYAIKLNVARQAESRRGLAAANATTPADTYNYLAERTKWGLSAEYSLSRRYSFYVSCNDIGGGTSTTLRYAPGTPEYAKPVRVQNDVYYTTVGVRGQF